MESVFLSKYERAEIRIFSTNIVSGEKSELMLVLKVIAGCCESLNRTSMGDL